jgi:beta-lactam-binding protein with PASTA domain
LPSRATTSGVTEPTEPYDREPRDREEYEREEIREERPPDGPPPWWREHWWIWGIVLLLLVGGLITFFALREADDDEEAAPPETVTVPEVVGREEADAVRLLEDRDFQVRVEREPRDEEDGRVVEQNPEAGTEASPGDLVVIIVSTGPTPTETEVETEVETETEPVEPQEVDVPDVMGQDHVDAGAAVDDAGLVANTHPVPDETQERGTVVAQNPDGGTRVNEGSPIRLNVAIGPDERESVQVPDVTGDDEADARRQCREAGLTCLTVNREAPRPDTVGRVILQEPSPGTSVEELTQIRLYVGR